MISSAARGLLLALAALIYLGGCAPKMAQVMDPATVAGRIDLKVSPEERTAFEAELKQGAKGLKEARARYFLGLAEFQEGRFPEAGRYFQAVSTGHANSGWDLPAIFMMAATLERMNDAPRAFVQYQRLIRPFPDPALPQAREPELSQKARAACRRIAESELDQEALTRLIEFPAVPEFQPLLRLKRLQKMAAAARGVTGTAAVDAVFLEVEEFLRRHPESPERAEVERLAREADYAGPVDRLAIGMMLPLTGRQAGLALQLRQGAEMALDELNNAVAPELRIKLLLADEGDTTVTAEASARKLMLESQVIGILGPMASDACQAVLPLAAARRTSMLSPFAIRPDLASASPYFFRNCLTPEKQALAMADHALLALRVTRVAALYPSTPYGELLVKAFSARMAEMGAPVLLSISYSAGSSDFKDTFVAMGGRNPSAMKDAETREKREQQASVERASSVLGKALLRIKADYESELARAQPLSASAGAYRALSFPARVAVFDFASSTSAAAYNASTLR